MWQIQWAHWHTRSAWTPLLAQGWEPFAMTEGARGLTTLWLRRFQDLTTATAQSDSDRLAQPSPVPYKGSM